MIGSETQPGLCSTIENILGQDYHRDYEIGISVKRNSDGEIWCVVMSLPGAGDYYRVEFPRDEISLHDHYSNITAWCVNNLGTPMMKR